ncbi:CUB domain-containing protein 1a [Antennarius striatus]|uniref:CUB domain-containing protein 1a n=1 Tax=Antennarius striatus TaxID=241820 RepID=UPI0035B073CB
MKPSQIECPDPVSRASVSASMSSAAAAALQLLLLTALTAAAAQRLSITSDRGTIIKIISTVKSSQGKGCKVCTTVGRSQQCDTLLVLKDNSPASVEFDCSRPQDVFNVEIVRNIECTTKSCNGQIVQADSGSRPLVGFNRKFIWNLKASVPKAFKIDFTNMGLKQIKASERCPDRHSYILQTSQTSGDVIIGKYCRMGPICDAQMLNQGSFSVDVPAGQELKNDRFGVSVGEEIKSLAKLTLTLPTGTSSSELLSANYPESFPDNAMMEWYFQVPDKHMTTVQLLNLTQPLCLKKDTAVEYNSARGGASVLKLTAPQPDQTQGSFSLTLRNCEMDRRRAGAPGLSLGIKVLSSSQNSPVSCKVEVKRMDGLSLHIKKLRPASGCLMKINSVPKEVITVTADGVLSFQGCLPEDVQVTATRVIDCSQLKDSPKAPFRLSVPPMPTCLPAPLTSVAWTLRVARDGAVELTSPMGNLKQALPGQPCNDSIIIKVAEENSNTIGLFCPQGPIQNVQVHKNVSVTVSNIGGRIFRMPVLFAMMKDEIPERYIFSVSPKKDTSFLLATPGWPEGMKDYSTVSWVVSFPTRMKAHLMFANLSQPKCRNGHTNIKVQRVGRLEEDYSRREDEEAESEIMVSESFFLNMSNCMAERGDFTVVTKITLQKSTNLLLTIILSVVAVLLVVFVIVLVAVCVVIRKKKKKLNHEVSIYNPNGTSFLPGAKGFPETHEDSEHEYASIEDTLVYTHLLRKGGEMGIYGDSDTYRPVTGCSDSQKPLASEGSSRQEARLSCEQAPSLPVRPPSHNHPLVDNVIYQADDQSEEECSLNLGPRLEPEGGN